MARPAMETGTCRPPFGPSSAMIVRAQAPRIHRGLSALAWRENPIRTFGKESGASSVTPTVGPARHETKKARTVVASRRPRPLLRPQYGVMSVCTYPVILHEEPRDAHRHVRLWAAVI